MKKRERWRNCFRCTLKNCIHTSIKNKLMTFYFFFVFTSFLYSFLYYLKKGGGRLQPRRLHLKLFDTPTRDMFYTKCTIFPGSLVVRIPRSHRGGRGSILRNDFLTSQTNTSFCIAFIRCQVTSYKDHFVQKQFRTRETISYKSTGVTSYKDFLYEVVPEFLHTNVEESFRTKTIFVQRRPQIVQVSFLNSNIRR